MRKKASIKKKSPVRRKTPTKIAGPKKGSELVVVLPDIHFPDENKEAMALVERVIALAKPSRTVILGDMLDGAPFSSHAPKSLKEVREANFINDEIKPGNEFLDHVQHHTKNETVFIEGNHEYRAMRWAINQGRGGLAVYDSFSPEVLLGKGRGRDFKYIPYIPANDIGLSYYDITPNLIAIHGWSTAIGCARVHLNKSRSKSVVFGHCHRQISEAVRDPFSKERLVAWSPGCLRTLQPSYMVSNPSSWVLGISFVYVGSNPRNWTEYNLTIQNGSIVLPDGTEIRGD